MGLEAHFLPREALANETEGANEKTCFRRTPEFEANAADR